MKKFEKNDGDFVCQVCGQTVPALKSSSRDHCTNCLCSLHVDINPGDRLNPCAGVLIPIDISQSNKKGFIINYKCNKCNQTHNNKSAFDDKFSTILKVMNKTYSVNNYKK